MERYPQDITQEEKNAGFTLCQIENPEGHLSNNLFIQTPQDITAVVKIIDGSKRIVKMKNQASNQILYSFQMIENGKWLPKDKYYSLKELLTVLENREY